jgi:Icc-related predicted phosphoesterase
MTYIVAAGDVHGALSEFYRGAAELGSTLEEPISAILQVGDLQIYSDTSHVDKAVRRHGGTGEFPDWLRQRRRVPITTYAILGNHDDAELFYEHAGKEILPSLTLIAQGQVVSIALGDKTIRIGALGGNYSPRYYKFKPAELPQGKLKHYTEEHLDSLIDRAPIDILLTHEAPTGFMEREGTDLGRPEIRTLIERTQPRFAFFGHHHRYIEGEIGSTAVIGLAGIGRAGSYFTVCS